MHGTGTVYFPTWIADFYGKWVAKYTSPMDPMWFGSTYPKCISLQISTRLKSPRFNWASVTKRGGKGGVYMSSHMAQFYREYKEAW